MTTKTQAAKAFAELYGTYNPRYGAYERNAVGMPSTATPSSVSSGTRIHEQYEKQMLKDAAEIQRGRADKAIADLKAVMRLLGADAQYEDDVEIVDDYSWSAYSWESPIKRKRITKTALQKFREDVRTVDKATDASAALTRLIGGTK